MTQRAKILGAVFTIIIGVVMVFLSLNDLRNTARSVSIEAHSDDSAVIQHATFKMVVPVPTATASPSRLAQPEAVQVISSYEVVIP